MRAIREALGIPQQDLALRVGVHPAYLSNLESGAKQPSVKVMRDIAVALGVSIDAVSNTPEQVAS